MNSKGRPSRAGMGSLLAVGTVAMAMQIAAQEEGEEQQAPELEKCYGVVKAGKNDCAGPGHACHGKATTDGHPEEFIVLPAGTCERLVNGSLTKGG